MKSEILRPLYVQEELNKGKVSFITPSVFSSIFHCSKEKTKYFLETHTKQGMFSRLKNGLYTLKKNFPKEEEISNALYKPSYISFEYALARYHIIPEMVYTISAATTKQARNFEVGQKIYSYYKIQKRVFIGYKPMKSDNGVILIAEPEKALVDFLYFVSLGKKSFNDRLNFKGLDKKKIYNYAKLYNRPGLMKLIERL